MHGGKEHFLTLFYFCHVQNNLYSYVARFVSYLAALLMLTSPIKRLTGIMEHLQRGLAACESVFGLIDQEPELDDGVVELEEVRGEITFEGVSFRYPGTDVSALKDIQLARLRELAVPLWAIIVLQALLRGTYHLYQGFGAFIGNVAMGLIFGAIYARTGRLAALIVGHTLIDAVAFVGYPVAVELYPEILG